MTFALETDTLTLWVFSSPERAMSCCEKYDVAEGRWSFFADDGSPLEPQFEPENRFLGVKVDVPGYILNESKRIDAPGLAMRLDEVQHVEGGPFSTVAEVREYLAKDQGTAA